MCRENIYAQWGSQEIQEPHYEKLMLPAD
jgi:hypothetical protein